ncbi:unnamed protein product [Urochloa humidicola]
MRMVIGGVRVEKDDVFIVVNQEGGLMRRATIRSNPGARFQIETNFNNYNCVIFEAKDMPHLLDNFGGLWTESAQYKISRVKKGYPNRYTFVLAYRGELMDALVLINQYLGGNISFMSDDFESFVGPHVGAAGTDEKRLIGHSGRCFIVGLVKFSS